MMQPARLNVPTVNFFARGGYERNPIVHGKTLAALDKRMDDNSQKPGAVEFAQVFDQGRRLQPLSGCSAPVGSIVVIGGDARHARDRHALPGEDHLGAVQAELGFAKTN